MSTPCRISLDYRHSRRHLISSNDYSITIEVLNPKFELRLNIDTEISNEDIVFAMEMGDNPFESDRIYFRVLHPENMSPYKPWTHEMFFDMAEYYIEKQWKLEPKGFSIVNELAMDAFRSGRKAGPA